MCDPFSWPSMKCTGGVSSTTTCISSRCRGVVSSRWVVFRCLSRQAHGDYGSFVAISVEIRVRGTRFEAGLVALLTLSKVSCIGADCWRGYLFLYGVKEYIFDLHRVLVSIRVERRAVPQ